MLALNFPGLYIPPVPGKKVVGNKDFKFILERRYFLERFFLKISAKPYLINSREGKVFTRPNLDHQKPTSALRLVNSLIESVPDIESLLQKLAQETPTQICNKYKEIFNLTPQHIATEGTQ